MREVYYLPESAQTVMEGFLWFPKIINGRCKWLVRARWREYMHGDECKWKPLFWED